MDSQSSRLCACGCGNPLPPTVRKREPDFLGYIHNHHPKTRAPLADRLWAKTVRGPDHWLWMGSRVRGYGRIRRGDRVDVNVGVHRVAWELASGEPVPAGFDVLHTCDIPNCVRNDEPGTYLCNGKLLQRFGHLFLGTDADNIADKIAKGRQSIGPKNVNTKLTAADVLAIRAVLDSTPNAIGSLAKKYAVHYATIRDIARHRTWKHVT